LKVPKDLIIIDEQGTVYQPNYESLKTALEIEDIHGYKVKDFLFMSYREMLFHYQAKEVITKLEEMQMAPKTNLKDIDYWSLYNSLKFLRSELTRVEDGNALISKANTEVENRWGQIYKNAPKGNKEKDESQ